MHGESYLRLCQSLSRFPYTCRNYVTQDILRRIMTDYFGYDVHFVQNVTDIDDKVCIMLSVPSRSPSLIHQLTPMRDIDYYSSPTEPPCRDLQVPTYLPHQRARRHLIGRMEQIRPLKARERSTARLRHPRA
jgi:hypothetical protein